MLKRIICQAQGHIKAITLRGIKAKHFTLSQLLTHSHCTLTQGRTSLRLGECGPHVHTPGWSGLKAEICCREHRKRFIVIGHLTTFVGAVLMVSVLGGWAGGEHDNTLGIDRALTRRVRNGENWRRDATRVAMQADRQRCRFSREKRVGVEMYQLPPCFISN